jgi:hypothetical protein
MMNSTAERFNRKNTDQNAPIIDVVVPGTSLPLVYFTQELEFAAANEHEVECLTKYLLEIHYSDRVGSISIGSDYSQHGDDTTPTLRPDFASQLNSLLGVQPFTLELNQNILVKNVLRVLDFGFDDLWIKVKLLVVRPS